MTTLELTTKPRQDVMVLKFGSSVLDGAVGLIRAADEVRCWLEQKVSVVAVVSALGDTTDRLLNTIHAITRTPCESASASVLGSGEDAAAALLAIALRDRDVRCVVATPETLRIVTRGNRLDADPIGVDTRWIETQFRDTDVVIVPGFVGRCDEGGPTLLGRGGSDLSALFLAWHLRAAQCRLIKDVDGVFQWDPSDQRRPPPVRLERLSWSEAARVADGLVQAKAIRYAEAKRQRFTVAALGGNGTVVGGHGDFNRLTAGGL